MKKTNIRRARRFVYDLTVLNDGGQLERSSKEMFP